MDGNGRWAQQKGNQRLFGHNAGIESVRSCTEFAVEKGIKYLSLYTFSEENWNRPQEEVEGLMKLMMGAIKAEEETFMKNGVRFMTIGNRQRLSGQLIEEIETLEKKSENNNRLWLILMLSYSGKWDILQAVNKYKEQLLSGKLSGEKPLDYSQFENFLATSGIPDPDLLIRTGGEHRISNYMLWQCAYSEFYFCDVLWPDFRKTTFQAALDSFENRNRRYGNIN